jgi:Taurine catabolism dioxygenase TauD, TfdA family
MTQPPGPPGRSGCPAAHLGHAGRRCYRCRSRRHPGRRRCRPGRSCRFVRSFAGLSTADSADLFALLQRHITRLENTVRWTWRDGDIAIWDNRATQHYAVADHDDLPRLLHRVTIAGEIPVGINGDTSVVRKGDASHYSRLAAWEAAGRPPVRGAS